LRWPPQYPVEDFSARTHGDPVVLGGDQEREANQRSIKQFKLRTIEIFKCLNVKALLERLPSSDPCGSSAAAIVRSSRVKSCALAPFFSRRP
jgi:hypothetical protein